MPSAVWLGKLPQLLSVAPAKHIQEHPVAKRSEQVSQVAAVDERAGYLACIPSYVRTICHDHRLDGGERRHGARQQPEQDEELRLTFRKPLNESRQVAESTMTAILGREAAYTGKAIKWDEIMNSDLDLSPPKYEFGDLAVGKVPIPGKGR